MPTELLVLSAFEPELSPLTSVLGDRADGAIGGFGVSARACGVGLSAAAVGAAMHIADTRPRAVLAVGTCGVYAASPFSLGVAIVARRVVLVDPASLRGATEIPDAVRTTSSADEPLSDGLMAAGAGSLVRADVATTLGVTVDDDMAALIARRTGAHVEHMEVHGMAAACAAAGVPFAAVLGVANCVGSRARSEWRSNNVAAAAAAVEHVLRWLKSGAPGLARRD